MSHFVVLVFGDPDTLEEQLAPYDENISYPPYFSPVLREGETYSDYWAYRSLTEEDGFEITDLESLAAAYNKKYGSDDERLLIQDGVLGEMSTYNPNSKWDWYQVGGRWSNMLRLKSGSETNSARLSEIDFERGQQEARDRAADHWKRFRDAVGIIPPPEKPWHEFRKDFEDIDAARAAWKSHPFIQALYASKDTDLYPFMEDLHEYYYIGEEDAREKFLSRAAAASISCYAYVHKGVWHGKGKMGWWGMSTDDMTDGQWYQHVAAFIESLPDDTTVTVVDCHI